MRIDLGNKAGSYDKWWIAGPSKAVAWHYLKFDEVSPSSCFDLFTSIPLRVLQDKLIYSLMLIRIITLWRDSGGWGGNLCGSHQGSIGIWQLARSRSRKWIDGVCCNERSKGEASGRAWVAPLIGRPPAPARTTTKD